MVRCLTQTVWLISVFLIKGINTHICKYHVCLAWTVSEKELNLKCRVSNLHFRVTIIDPSNKIIGECFSSKSKSNCHTHSHNVVIAQNMTTNETTCSIRGTIDEKMNGKWKCLHGTNKGLAEVEVTVLRYKDRICRPMLLSVIGYFGTISLWLTFMSVSPIKLNIIEGFYKRVSCKKAKLIPACKGITFLVLTVLILMIFWIYSNSTQNSCRVQYAYCAFASLCGLLVAVLFLNKEGGKYEQVQSSGNIAVNEVSRDNTVLLQSTEEVDFSPVSTDIEQSGLTESDV